MSLHYRDQEKDENHPAALRLRGLGHNHPRNITIKKLQRKDRLMAPIRSLGSSAPLDETIKVNGQKCPSPW